MNLKQLSAQNKEFVCMVLAKNQFQRKKANRRNKAFIDKWLSIHYEHVYRILNAYSFILRNGISSIDKLNNQIDILYHDPDLSFKSQQEANDFLDKELHWQRFIIKLRINY